MMFEVTLCRTEYATVVLDEDDQENAMWTAKQMARFGQVEWGLGDIVVDSVKSLDDVRRRVPEEEGP